MWAEMLGFGDFYYELGVQIVEACWATRAVNGGLMELPVLLRCVNTRRGTHADPISEDDVVSGPAAETVEAQSIVCCRAGHARTSDYPHYVSVSHEGVKG